MAAFSGAPVTGPVGVSVADARVEEGAGAVLAFAVTLGRAVRSAFSVDYATSDGTAQARVDYAAKNGTLSFQAGESSGMVEVAVLDDAHDEGEEALTLRLSNASGAQPDGRRGDGTIENTDLTPAGAAGALRSDDGRAGGHPHRGADGGGVSGRASRVGSSSRAASGSLRWASCRRSRRWAWSRGVRPRRAARRWVRFRWRWARTRPPVRFDGVRRNLFPDSEFEAEPREPRRHRVGMEQQLPVVLQRDGGRASLDGDVRTTMVGADYSHGALTLGLSVGRTVGLGGYSGPSGGRITTSVPGLYPWVGQQVNGRARVMMASAVGTRGELVGSRATGGFALA